MLATFSLTLEDTHPISTNKMYYSFRRKGSGTFRRKSEEYFAFTQKVHTALQACLTENPGLKDIFLKIAEHGCNLTINTYMPYSSYYTKAGIRKAIDSSNFIKPLEDSIFTFFEANVAPNVKDQHVITVTSSKHVSKNDGWSVTFTLDSGPGRVDEFEHFAYIYRYDGLYLVNS